MIKNLPETLLNDANKLLNEALASSAHKAMATKASNKAADGLTNAQRISNDVMDSDRVNIPLERTLTPDKNVDQHLKSKGYHIDNYEQGLAYHESNPSRKFRIGRVLNQIDAPQHIKTAYEKDPARQGINSTNASIVISRHPYDVAAMSTHQNWQSCQTLGGKATVTDKEGNKEVKEQSGGMYKEMVPDIVKSGAHIAYLVNHPDDITKHYAPIARVTLNPYVSPSGHTILRPSEEYGDHWEGFKSTVKSWSEKHFPLKDALYFRHGGAYPEGESQIRNYDPKYNEFWKNNHDQQTLSEHPDQEVLHHHTNSIIEEGAGGMASLIQNPHLSNEDSGRLIRKFADNPRQNQHLARYARNPEQIQVMLDKNLGSFTIAHQVSKNNNTSSEQLHHVLDTYGASQTNIPGVRKFEHNGYSPDIINSVVRHPNSDESHYHKIFELQGVNGDRFDRMNAFVDNWDTFEGIAHKYHSEDIGKKLSNLFHDAVGDNVPHNIVHDIAMKHPHLVSNFSDEVISKGLDHHPGNENLQKIAKDRNTPTTLIPLARATKDTGLLDSLEQHPNGGVSNAARLQKIFLNTKT